MSSFEDIVKRALGEGRTFLMEHESKQILAEFGLETTGAYFATSADEAIRIANQIGYPVVLKVLSKEVVHKSEVGGVKLNLADEDAVRRAYREMESAFRNRGMIGVSVQKMAKPGLEVFVGVATDPTFGHLIMFGLGGIFVEVLRDVSMRILPISEEDAESMIKEVKGYQLLKGYRGVSGDVEALKRVLLRISELVQNYPLIKEMDLNPIFLYPKGYAIADARIILHDTPPKALGGPGEERRATNSEDLRDLLYPRSVAVIGASNTPGKLGWNLFRNLISHGYKGRLYPVNPNAGEVQGFKAYRSIREVPEKVDVAIVLVPSHLTPKVVEECCVAGAKHIIVESAGFAELGEEGKKVEDELRSIIERHGSRLVGPNCAGIINTYCGFVGTFGLIDELAPGNVGLIAQAGVYVAGYLWGLKKVLDFGIIATIGNKLDIDETDVLEALGGDDNIKVVCMYLEDVKRGRKFIEVAKKVTKRKPVIVLKTGRTEAGKRAILSHTASLAGKDEVYDAAFKQVGVIRAKDNEHMFALARAFSKQPLPKSDGVFVVTYTGSFGVAAADAISLNGMRLAEPSAELKSKLRELLPPFVSALNPMDLTFEQSPEQVKKAIEIVAQSEDVGSFIVVAQAEKLGSYVEPLRFVDSRGKPVLVVVPAKEFVMDDVIRLERAGIPVYATPEQAVDVLATMYHYKVYRDKHGALS
jgi:acyl-CoA synthetase (NDP forming)